MNLQGFYSGDFLYYRFIKYVLKCILENEAGILGNLITKMKVSGRKKCNEINAIAYNLSEYR